MEQLASRNINTFNTIGLGTQDNLAQAKGFYDIASFSAVKLVWDSSGQSWRSLRVFGQPSWLLFDAQGNQLTSSVRSGAPTQSAIDGLLS